MTTPPQDKIMLETPFGTCEIRDSRYYSNHQDNRPTLARIWFENGLTVNRKDYSGVHFELQRAYFDGEPYHVSVAGYAWGDLTESARNKVAAWFQHEDRRDMFKPYLEPLDPKETRRQIKSSIHSGIASELHKEEGKSAYPEDARNSGLVKELMTEVLKDALAWVESGKSFSSFYFDGNKAGK
jgi:hypothetical protein